MKFPTLIEKRTGKPNQQQDDWISDHAWKEPEENRQECQHYADSYSDACFDGFDHTPIRKRGTN